MRLLGDYMVVKSVRRHVSCDKAVCRHIQPQGRVALVSLSSIVDLL
jgi:hypothetical protein